MINRRSFGKQIAASVPVVTILAAVAGRSQEQPPAPPSGTPPAGRGQGGRGGPGGGRGPAGPPDPMAGSPVGDPLPGQKWRVHDHNRPQPRKVTPGKPIPTMSAPSDAIVLFDGKDLSQWTGGAGRGGGPVQEPRWKIADGHMEMAGGLVTKESFGDIQLHLEWTTPTGVDPSRIGQQRGNSGIVFMGRYEVQILSGFNNPTYPDGGVAGIYGVYPPMVNPCLPEGEWNTFDFVFEAPKFDGEKLVKPAFITLFFNGIMVHNRAELLGTTNHEPIAVYTAHAPELPLQLQGHAGPAWFRNVWVRRILGYDA